MQFQKQLVDPPLPFNPQAVLMTAMCQQQYSMWAMSENYSMRCLGPQTLCTTTRRHAHCTLHH